MVTVGVISDTHGLLRSAVICGHSHQPLSEQRDGVLHFIPGSAGPRRFQLPTTAGRLQIGAGRIEAKIIPLSASRSG